MSPLERRRSTRPSSNSPLLGEIERRYELWGQPGKIKITGFLNRGSAGNFNDAVRACAVYGNAGRHQRGAFLYQPSRRQPQPRATDHRDHVGVFFRAGWADGNIEPWDFTDIDRTVSGGVSIGGKSWGRPDDTIGIAGVVNGISSAHVAFLNAGGLGILLGDGQLTNYGTEEDFRGLLQHRAECLDQAHLRLSVHRQSRLQRRSRSGECLRRASALAVLRKLSHAAVR